MQFHPETCHKNIQSPWGSLTLAANPTGLSGVWFEKQKHFPDTHAWTLANQHPTLLQAEQSLQKYFDQKWPRACSARKALENLALDLSAGTDFQKAVWNALMSIPLGQTCSYGQLAAAIGRPMAVRAVGTAVGRNPISILIPCHRVMGSQGQITGYAGGVWRKQALLKLENASINPSSAGHNQ
ncbi:MAG: methylated-DNA--[protein]-cysteine S-methyltransferase [Betaproteobacteria bacterium]|jgi:methylated-DNA-[protein]-cysteine S-methyltransferase